MLAQNKLDTTMLLVPSHQFFYSCLFPVQVVLPAKKILLSQWSRIASISMQDFQARL